MDNLSKGIRDLREVEGYAKLQSPIHSLHPLTKLIVTIAYILITVSFGKYELGGLLTMIVYPALIYTASKVPVNAPFLKLWLIFPLLALGGLFNPLLDRRVILHIGELAVTGGVVSMCTLIIKGIFCVMASFLLAATTGIEELCVALREIKIPGVIVNLFRLTYRYISIMMEELYIMNVAYSLRAPGQRGIHMRAWGSFLGQLLLRTVDRAGEVQSSMKLRGDMGDFSFVRLKSPGIFDPVYALAWLAIFFILRCFNISGYVGSLL